MSDNPACVIAVYSIKGGVGKTTTVLQFAVHLAELNKKVLCIDMDSQGNLSKMFNKAKELSPRDGEDTVKGVYEIFRDHAAPEEIIRTTAFDELGDYNIDFIPAGWKFRDIDLARELCRDEGKALLRFDDLWGHNLPESIQTEILTRKGAFGCVPDIYRAPIRGGLKDEIDAELILKKWVDSVRDRYDFIFIDVNPTRNIIADSALASADYVIAPALLEGFSEDGVADLFGEMEKVRKKNNRDLAFAGILLTSVSPNTTISNEMCDRLWTIVDDPQDNISARAIRRDNAVVEAGTRGIPLSFWKRKSKACTDYIHAEYSLDLISKEERDELLVKHGITNDNYEFDIDPAVREQKTQIKKAAMKAARERRKKIGGGISALENGGV